MTKSGGIEIVFFDAGLTLLRPHPSFPELFASVLRNEGIEVTEERVHEIDELLAFDFAELTKETGILAPSLSADDSYRFWTYVYRRILGALGIEDPQLERRLYETFSSASSYALFEDALPAIEKLEERDYRLGLISNFEEWLEGMLVELEVGHVFDVAVISGVVGVEKPDPRIYEIALERAGVSPDRAVHVGDSPSLDVAPATQVGMHAILLDRGGRYPDHDGPRIDSLEGLPGAVSKL
jgi:putative hydrolase of the HAD superfamily